MITVKETLQTKILITLYLITPILSFLLLLNLLSLKWEDQYIYFVAISLIISMIMAYLKNLLNPIHQQNLFESALFSIVIWLTTLAILVTLIFLLGETENYSRKLLVYWSFANILLFIIIRLVFKKNVLQKDINVLVIGNKYIFTEHEKNRLTKQKIKLIVIENYIHLNIEAMRKVISDKSINILAINTDEATDELTKFIIKQELAGIDIINLESFMEKYLRKYYIPKENKNLDYLNNIKHFNVQQRLIKKIINISGGVLLLLISLPIFIYVVFKIKNESPGKILFKQQRMGKNSIKFNVLKFRTMHENSYFDPYTKEEDTRIFPFGKIMRKTRIDELPQAINILKGDMNLIGPRAEWDILSNKYLKDIPYYELRHLVKPGITGWAQVNYPYGANIEDSRQKLMYDLFYIKNWSLALELEIACKTILVVVNKKGL